MDNHFFNSGYNESGAFNIVVTCLKSQCLSRSDNIHIIKPVNNIMP